MGLLDNVLGGTGARSGGGMSPLTMALMGVLAYRTFKGKGRLADMLGMGPEGQNAGARPAPGAPPAQGGGLGGLLGGLFGGAGAGALSGGLGDLLRQFQQNGQGDKMQSWIGTGPNKSVSPNELENGLGEERIARLMQQTGMSREELLSGLSRELPQAVDRLTPDGRILSEQEAARRM